MATEAPGGRDQLLGVGGAVGGAVVEKCVRDRLGRGPGALCCRAYTWINVSLSNKIQGDSKGLKMTTHLHNWGKS